SGDGQRFLIITKVDEANAAPLSVLLKLGLRNGEMKLFVPQRTPSRSYPPRSAGTVAVRTFLSSRGHENEIAVARILTSDAARPNAARQTRIHESIWRGALRWPETT